MAGGLGGAVGGGITGGLLGGTRGAVQGAMMGAVFGGIAGGVGGSSWSNFAKDVFQNGSLIAGGAYSIATGHGDMFAGALIGGMAGYAMMNHGNLPALWSATSKPNQGKITWSDLASNDDMPFDWDQLEMQQKMVQNDLASMQQGIKNDIRTASNVLDKVETASKVVQLGALTVMAVPGPQQIPAAGVYTTAGAVGTAAGAANAAINMSTIKATSVLLSSGCGAAGSYGSQLVTTGLGKVAVSEAAGDAIGSSAGDLVGFYADRH